MSCLYSMHYNPDLWDEPDKFKPERFLNPNGSFNYCDSLYQFGFGKCPLLGMHQFRFLSYKHYFL
jgi:Cytochrome P450